MVLITFLWFLGSAMGPKGWLYFRGGTSWRTFGAPDWCLIQKVSPQRPQSAPRDPQMLQKWSQKCQKWSLKWPWTSIHWWKCIKLGLLHRIADLYWDCKLLQKNANDTKGHSSKCQLIGVSERLAVKAKPTIFVHEYYYNWISTLCILPLAHIDIYFDMGLESYRECC